MVQVDYRPGTDGRSPAPFTDVKVSYVNPALKPQGPSFNSTGQAERWDRAPDGVKQAIQKFVTQPQSKQVTAERIRDPEDWDEGNTEPPNNFAVYVNGKKIAVFQGRGRYADDQREQAHHEQLKGWARKKSAETGKTWEVSITGEPATR
jgi:hypothetical protein